MKFDNTKIKILGLAALVIVALFALFFLLPKHDRNEQSANLSPLALEMLDHCVTAALLGKPLTEKDLIARVGPKIEALSGSGSGDLSFEIGKGFECWVEIPSQNYNLKELRKHLTLSKSSLFDGLTEPCNWLIKNGLSPSSTLVCSVQGKSEPANFFLVSISIVAFERALFWVRPM